MQLYPHQLTMNQQVDNAYAAGHKNVMLVSPCGSGKCLGKGTPVLMFNGTIKPVEKIIQGDLLMGPDSKPRRVSSICRGSEMMYRVIPIKGDPYVVNESHILSLKRIGNMRIPKYLFEKSNDGIVNISVSDYLKKSKDFKLTHKGWRTGVEFGTKKLHPNLPPYFLGLWLGDGHKCSTSITTIDPEVIEYVYNLAEQFGLRVRVENENEYRTNTYNIVPNGTLNGRGGNIILQGLRHYGLKDNKYIPHDYLTGDTHQRLEILAGLLDSDGHLQCGGYDFINKNEKITDGVVFLCRSLGLAAYKVSCVKSCNGVSGNYFRCSISGNTEMIPCRVERKKAKPRRIDKSVLKMGIKVEAIGHGDYYGFELENSDGLFLLGDFTVTHNTAIFSYRSSVAHGGVAAIAHRQELVGQMSLTLAKYGVTHRIIGPPDVVKFCIAQQTQELGRDYYNPSALVAAVGIDTLLSWSKPKSPHYSAMIRWASQVSEWIVDEGHHLLADNKWGRGVALFTNARGLAVTGTAERSDGKGLGRKTDGLIDHLIVGPSARDLINGMPDHNGNIRQYLTDYRIICPPNDLDVSQVKIGADGDLVRGQLALATKRSTIMGDVVKHYKIWADGKLGITFAPDVETATMFMKSFNDAGVRAEVVTAKTPARLRVDLIRKFRRREIMMLVNVDLFGEGFDLPAIEVVIMARRTESYALFVQQFMRGCRMMEGKDRAIIIDHVNNVIRHGLPDAPRQWSLERRDKKTKCKNDDDGVVPLRNCLNPLCMQPFERVLPFCPFCGWIPVPTDRSGPEMVDGVLHELDPAVLATMRGELLKIDDHPNKVLHYMQAAGYPYPIAKGVANRHSEKQAAQKDLRDLMSLWCGFHKSVGRGIHETQARFYHRFGLDVLSAQILGRSEAQALMARVGEDVLKLTGGVR